MSRRLAAPLVAALLAAGTLLAGCADSGDDQGSGSAAGSGTSAGSSSTSSTSSSSSASASSTGGAERPGDGSTDAPPFPANTEPDTSEASDGAQVTVSDIRTGRHDGFDRVVFEVGGTGTPGWNVSYVGQASSQGSGEPIDVAGNAVLEVIITGAGLPADTGVTEFDGPDPLPGSGTSTVTEVAFDSTFEGQTVAFVGTTATVPFRVYALSNPTRVVVEVQDA